MGLGVIKKGTHYSDIILEDRLDEEIDNKYLDFIIKE